MNFGAHNGQAAKLELTPLSTVLPKAQEWLWSNMIPAGSLTLLAGAGGTSKSTLMAHIAARVTRGELPGIHHSSPKGVIYLTREMDEATSLKPMMLQANADQSKTYIINEGVHAMLDISETQHRARLIELAVINDVSLIIVDPIGAYTMNMGHSYKQAISKLTPLTEACAEHNIAVVGINHLLKHAKKAEASSMLGSVGLASTARQVLMVGKTDQECLVSVVKSNVGPTGTGWIYTVDFEAALTLPDGSEIVAPVVDITRPARQSETEAMFEDHLDPTKDMRISTMLFYLYRNPDADSSDTQQHLAQEFAVSERTARKTIQAALGHGLVSRTASGGSGDLNYQLHITDDGMKLLGKVDYDKFAPADLSGMVDHAAARWAGGN